MSERAEHHEFRIEFDALDCENWQPYLRATGYDAACIALTEFREVTTYPWRAVKVTVIEEILII